MNNKPRSDAFSEKLSEEQHTQLIQWLAQHSYDEVLDFIKAEPPTGFGFETSKPTLSRYYHEHSYEIDKVRQDRILCRALDHQRMLLNEEGARYLYHEAAALRLQEHLCDLLSQPITSAADLKALASVTKLITALDVDLSDPDKDWKTMQKLKKFMAEERHNNSETEPAKPPLDKNASTCPGTES
jgi:hypothetical protein